MGEVHANGSSFTKDGESGIAGEKFGAEAERIVGSVTGAEHPLVAAHGAHTAAHLVGERLKSDALIYRRQRAGNSVARPGSFLDGEKLLQRLLETALQQMLGAFERNHAARARRQFAGQMKPVNRVKKKQRADALVKIISAAAESVEFRAGGE